jgi:hypothetical protein
MKNNIINIFTFVLVALALPAYAQMDQERKRELIEKLKKEYLLEQLELEEGQQGKFEDLYDDYTESKIALRQERIENRQEIRTKLGEGSGDEMTEGEASDILQAQINRQMDMLDKEREFQQNMIAQMGAVKTLKFYQAEKNFRKELLRMIKDKEEYHDLRKELLEEREKPGKGRFKQAEPVEEQ